MNMIERIATVVVVVDYDERLKILWIKKMNAMKWLVECKLNNDDSDEDDEESAIGDKDCLRQFTDPEPHNEDRQEGKTWYRTHQLDDRIKHDIGPSEGRDQVGHDHGKRDRKAHAADDAHAGRRHMGPKCSLLP